MILKVSSEGFDYEILKTGHYKVFHRQSNYSSTGIMAVKHGVLYVTDSTGLENVPVNGKLASTVKNFLMK